MNTPDDNETYGAPPTQAPTGTVRQFADMLNQHHPKKVHGTPRGAKHIPSPWSAIKAKGSPNGF